MITCQSVTHGLERYQTVVPSVCAFREIDFAIRFNQRNMVVNLVSIECVKHGVLVILSPRTMPCPASICPKLFC